MFSSLLALVLLLTFSSLFGTITFAYFFFTCVCSNCQPQKTKISPDSGKKEQWIVGSCAVTITKDMPQVNQSTQMSPSHQQGWPALCSTADSWFDQRYQTAFPPLISSETTKLHIRASFSVLLHRKYLERLLFVKFVKRPMVAQIRSDPANVVNIDLISITCGSCTIMLRFVQITRYSPNCAVSPGRPA